MTEHTHTVAERDAAFTNWAEKFEIACAAMDAMFKSEFHGPNSITDEELQDFVGDLILAGRKLLARSEPVAPTDLVLLSLGARKLARPEDDQLDLVRPNNPHNYDMVLLAARVPMGKGADEDEEE